jgi:hypothetical protein
MAPFAERIVETLGYLALAIAVAGKAIRHGYATIQNYLQYFEEVVSKGMGKAITMSETLADHFVHYFQWAERRSYKAHDSDKPVDDFEEQRYVSLCVSCFFQF